MYKEPEGGKWHYGSCPPIHFGKPPDGFIHSGKIIWGIRIGRFAVWVVKIKIINLNKDGDA